MSDIESGDG